MNRFISLKKHIQNKAFSNMHSDLSSSLFYSKFSYILSMLMLLPPLQKMSISGENILIHIIFSSWGSLNFSSFGKVIFFCIITLKRFKFMIIWRFARLWALIDGIESPENMNRCVANNYSFESFWRSWHRSFNQWLIRYIFVPLGGSKYKLYNVWVVFSFVAIWHDVDLNLIYWSWIICLTMMPEMAVKWYFYGEKVSL